MAKADGESIWSDMLDLVRYNHLSRPSSRGLTAMVIGLVLLCVGSRVAWKAKGGPKPKGLIIGEALLLILAVLLIGLMLIGTAHF